MFPGYEVSGVVDELGSDVESSDIAVGKRVVLYPYDGIPHGYAEYMVVPDLSYLVPIPDDLSLSVAAMLPTGALLAKNAIVIAHNYVTDILRNRTAENPCKILIVGTGGLALWAIRCAEYQFRLPELKDRVKITVAILKDDGFRVASQLSK